MCWELCVCRNSDAELCLASVGSQKVAIQKNQRFYKIESDMPLTFNLAIDTRSRANLTATGSDKRSCITAITTGSTRWALIVETSAARAAVDDISVNQSALS